MLKQHFFSNQEIADLLRKVASAYSVENENRFRITAYEAAAAAIEHSTSEIKDLWDEGQLETVPGVGSSIAQHLDELFNTGKVKHFEAIFKSLPPAMFIFEKIPGVGPKRAFALAKDLKINDEKNALIKLKKAILAGKVNELPGFGQKSAEVILKGLESLSQGEQKTQRMPLYLAVNVADEIIKYLKSNPNVLAAYPLGSLRRQLVTIGDIDLGVSTQEPKKVMDYFFQYPKIKRVISRGETALGRALLVTGQQVDIRLSSPESFGAMLQYFTGSKQHNINLREYALNQGLSLSEYGIKPVKSSKFPYRASKVQSYKDEESFYGALGLAYIPPEIREGQEEIEAAKAGKIPKLVELSDIKGDLHLHSDFPIEPSHDLGQSTITEIVLQAEKLGYQYLGFAEHNPSSSRHSAKTVIDLLKRKKELIEQFSYPRVNKLFIKIFNGLEIDIKPSGELAIPEEGFDYLDYALVSVHTSFDMNREKMTERVLKGLSHPKAKILAHPTGRLLGSRESYELDWEKIFDFCLREGKFLEINAWPTRMDLPDFLVKEAVKKGLQLIINTDSHAVNQMTSMAFGVSVARRGWAQKNDILNTLPLEEFSDILLNGRR